MRNIVYFGVARVSDTCPVADYAPTDSKEYPKSVYTQKFERLLSSFDSHKRPRLTITDKDVGHIHYNSGQKLLLMVICAPEYPQSTALKLLAEARPKLLEELGNDLASSKAFGLTKQVKPFLKDLIAKYEEPARIDKMAKAVVEVEQVKSIMQKNIQATINNHGNLEMLLDSSDAMRNEANTFNRSTVQVKQKMQWKNTKMWIFIIVLLICLVAVAVVPIVLHRRKEAANKNI